MTFGTDPRTLFCEVSEGTGNEVRLEPALGVLNGPCSDDTPGKMVDWHQKEDSDGIRVIQIFEIEVMKGIIKALFRTIWLVRHGMVDEFHGFFV